MNIAIVDDENSYLNLIEKIINMVAPSNEIKKYQDSSYFLKNSSQFDLVFLDISMPYLDGIKISKLLYDIPIEIVFVTSHDERMIEAFGKNVIGFVPKESLEIGIKNIFDNMNKMYPFIKVQNRHTEAIVYLDEIEYIHYHIRDITLHLLNQEDITIKEMSLKNLLPQLDDTFIVINRSTIVNIYHILDYRSGYVFLKNKKFSVSRRNLKSVQIKFFERRLAYARTTKQ